MDRPKIGLALSGASGRAITHAAILDVFKEQGIPVDYIAACSSATIIAASYAAGTLPELKKFMFDGLDRRELFGLFVPSERGGLFSLKKVDHRLSEYTKNLQMENSNPQLGFVTVDLDAEKQVVISMGDINKAIMASCSVPGLFEPTKWGGKNLVDGGMLNIVPADVVKTMGADIVISVDIAAARYCFSNRDIKLFKSALWLIKGFGWPYFYARSFLNWIKRTFLDNSYIQIYTQADAINESEKIPGLLEVIGRCISISKQWETNPIRFEKYSDIIIEPRVKHYGKTEFSMLRQAYLEGRKVAQMAVPKIRQMMTEMQAGKIAPIPHPANKPLFINETTL